MKPFLEHSLEVLKVISLKFSFSWQSTGKPLSMTARRNGRQGDPEQHKTPGLGLRLNPQPFSFTW